MASGGELCPLPPQPDGVPWPAASWPIGELVPTGELARLVGVAMDPSSPLGQTFALLVVQGGRLVLARYGGALERFDAEPEPVTPATPLLSWSMAKSVLHAAVGVLVGQGRLDPKEPAAVPAWAGPEDPRSAITVEHLLEMRDGLAFAEDYEDEGRSDVIAMLFGKGRHDVAAFAADRPQLAAPGAAFHYSSGTTNILSGIVARLVGPGETYRAFLADRLFGPLHMASAEPGFDDAGTWVASSWLNATAEDYARFGLLYLRDGVAEGRRVLPAGWVDHGRRARSVDPEDGRLHGAHWWVEDDGFGTFRAAGFSGQAIVVIPGLDAVVVRLGRTEPAHSEDFAAWRSAIVVALAQALGA